MSTTLQQEYEARYTSALAPTSIEIERFLREVLIENNIKRIDRVCARPKSVDRFLQKAKMAVPETGQAKYGNPLKQIQDQIGARIITFYLDDVDRVANLVKMYFNQVEDKLIIPDSVKEFDYIGRHFILFIEDSVIPEGVSRDLLPDFFELQVKTLFQHAWAEANHDIVYKPQSLLTADQRRRAAFIAAQSWGADRIFQELGVELGAFDEDIESGDQKPANLE